MRQTTDNPVDPLGSIGKPIKPAAPAPMPASKPFETGDWAPKGLVISDKPTPTPDPLDPRTDYDWGCDLLPPAGWGWPA